MNNIILWLGTAAVLGTTVYYGYHYAKKQFYSYVMKKVTEELDKRMEIEEQHFKPIHSDSALIKVTHAGKSHSVYVPYDRKKSTSMLRKKVYLIKNGEKTDISQKPGIPYLVSAKQMGGKSIIVEDMSGEIIKTYSEDEIPNYL